MNQRKFFILMAYSLIIIVLIFLPRYVTLSQGKDILLSTEPSIPRDIFRGDYVILNYDIANVDLEKIQYDYDFLAGETIYTVLSEKEKYWTIDSASHKKPVIKNEEVCMKGTVRRENANILFVEWGIESYFVPEVEIMDSEREIGNVSVIVSVDSSCSAVIKQLLINGDPASFK